MTKASEGLAKLREPFPAETIGKLPRISCKDCRDAQGKCCQKHQKQKCRECGNWITTAHLHLDYVGHAEVTDRLLTVDPEWTWEPFSVDERGLPAFILNNQGAPVGLWIKLTVLGVTRCGYGSVEGYKPEAVKELIGDALRNASMRFGVALDLWSKADLESGLQDSQATPPSETSPALPADSGQPESGAAGATPPTGGNTAPQSGGPSSATPDSPPPMSTDEQLEHEDLLRLLKDWVGGNDSKHSRVRAEVAKASLEQNVPPPEIIANASLPVLRAVASVLLTKAEA